MLERVKDPKIIQQLNSQIPQYERVNDDNIIKQLNSSIDTNWKPPSYPFVTTAQTPEQTSENIQQSQDILKGAAQSYINTPEEAANVFGQHLYNKFNFAPQNKASEIGKIAGDTASFFLPSNAISLGLKGLSLIPKAGKVINAIKLGLKERPVTNFLKNVGQTASEAALFQAEKNPNSKGIDVAKAGGIGGLLSAATNALTNQNPLISTAAKLLLGGGIGYQYGDVPGAAEGAGAALFGPRLLQELGIGGKPVSSEILTQNPTPQALAKYRAGQRIGDVGTPAEVFNSPGMGVRQGEISRSELGAQHMTDFGAKRIEQQKNAIDSLLNKIFPNTEEANNEIKNLYNQSYQHDLTANAINDLYQDPVMTQASKKVRNDPVYRKELKNIRPTNYAYLDQVKRAIDDMEQSAIRAGENNKARIYGESSQKLTDIMDKESPEYVFARKEAQRRIIRREMTERLNKRPITGKNFFREFLSNENKFNELITKVKNIPGASQDLKDMKMAWDNLIGFDTPATAAGMTSKHTNTPREGFQKFWNEFKDTIGAPRDVERAKFIQDPNWWNKFDEVIKYKSKVERNKALGDLISRGLAAGTLEYSKETK